jgi:citrate synthase
MLGVVRRSRLSALLIDNSRAFSRSAPVQFDELKAAFAECLPKEQKRLKAIKQEHASKDIHSVNVGMVLGGMRGITGLLYETSLLDADEGIRFRGYSIPELQVHTMQCFIRLHGLFELSCLQCLLREPASDGANRTGTNSRIHSACLLQQKLPKAPGGSQPLPEGLLWLLLTGQVPSESQVQGLSRDLLARSEIPAYVHAMLKSLPTGTHPMTQFSMAIMALQPDSLFARAYQDGASNQ